MIVEQGKLESILLGKKKFCPHLDRPTLFEIAEKTFTGCLEILKKKNHDYSKGGDEFRNFRLVSHVRPKLTAFDGLIVRLCDKIARLGNLIDSEAKVKDESILDTLDDAINYLVITKAMYMIENKLV